jgi:hypothetical protein
MSLRHAFKVVLAGWVLLVPRILYESGTNTWTVTGYDKHKKPVYSVWDNYGSFDTKAGCENELKKLDPTASPVMPTAEGAVRNPAGLANVVRDSVKQAVCIPSDDPSLKQN